MAPSRRKLEHTTAMRARNRLLNLVKAIKLSVEMRNKLAPYFHDAMTASCLDAFSASRDTYDQAN